jgi:hypothetical protein
MTVPAPLSQAQRGGLLGIGLTGKGASLPRLLAVGQPDVRRLLGGGQPRRFGLGQWGGFHHQPAPRQLLHLARGGLPARGVDHRGPPIRFPLPVAATRLCPPQGQLPELGGLDPHLPQAHRLRHSGDKAKLVRRGQGDSVARKALAVSHQERLTKVGQVLAPLREMEARRGAVTLVAIGDVAPHR